MIQTGVTGTRHAHTNNARETGWNLEGEGNGHADDEEEEGHDEVGEVAAVPRRVPDDRPLAAGAVDQYHQLHAEH